MRIVAPIKKLQKGTEKAKKMLRLTCHMSGVACHLSPERDLRSAAGAGVREQVQARVGAGERAENQLHYTKP